MMQKKIVLQTQLLYFWNVLTIKFIKMKKYVVLLLHMGYWIMYFLMITMFVSSLNHGGVTLRQIIYAPVFIAAMVPGFIGFYVFYCFLFERYLSKKRILNLILAVIATSILAAIIAQVVLYSVFWGKIDKSYNTIVFGGLFMAFIAFVSGILGLVMKGFITWYGDLKVKVELTKRNYEMELALMKAQINPHFLFNTINNIDVLIQKDAAKASVYLNKLSNMMRFMLYESKTGKIPLEKELQYIEEYVELQKIRTSNNNYIHYEVNGKVGDFMIEPMLFIPFIENAFKHTENKKLENAIHICFTLHQDKITLECENALSISNHTKPEYGGLGNELIHRRLQLLYPNKHTFAVSTNDLMYKVNLVLSL